MQGWESEACHFGLGPGLFQVRTGEYQSTLQKKKQYKSPLDQIFPSKFQVIFILKKKKLEHLEYTS